MSPTSCRCSTPRSKYTAGLPGAQGSLAELINTPASACLTPGVRNYELGRAPLTSGVRNWAYFVRGEAGTEGIGDGVGTAVTR